MSDSTLKSSASEILALADPDQVKAFVQQIVAQSDPALALSEALSGSPLLQEGNAIEMPPYEHPHFPNKNVQPSSH